MVQFVSAETVHRLLDYPVAVEGLIKAHLEDFDEAHDYQLNHPVNADTTNVLLALPAWQWGKAVGIKIVTVFPENAYTGTGLPTVQGIYALFDGKIGKLVSLIDGTALTLRKTASDSAAGARFLARHDASRMLMVGAGAMAPHLVMAHRAIRPTISHVMIWNRTEARAQRLAADLSCNDCRVEAVADLEAAARTADIVSCATMATVPLIRGEWLKNGAHLDLIGGYQPHMRESDDECVRRARVYVDSRRFALDRVGDICQPLHDGIIDAGDIAGDLFDLARGICTGRRNDEEITLYKNAGGGHLDLWTARVLMDRMETT